MDIITRFSNAQAITVDVVSDLVLTFGSDAKRNVFMNEPHLIKVLVAVIAAGGAEGLTIEMRADTAAGLATAPIVIGSSGLILPGQMETVGKIHEFRIRPIALPAGYDFMGIYYNVHTNVFSGSFALTTWLADEGSEAGLLDAPMTL